MLVVMEALGAAAGSWAPGAVKRQRGQLLSELTCCWGQSSGTPRVLAAEGPFRCTSIHQKPPASLPSPCQQAEHRG